MTVEWPRGKTESQRLEFKGRDVLKQMKSISREVAAMLNASGGEIWIGLAEEAGVAVRVESIESIGERRQALWNHLVDTLDPTPKHGEVSIDPVNTTEGWVLRLEVTSGTRKPYAYRDDGPRFVQRIGTRVRPMTTQELRQLFNPGAASVEGSGSLLEPLLKERMRLAGEGKAKYWVRLQPDRRLDLDYEHVFLRFCLSNPRATGNRESGWTFRNPLDPPVVLQGYLLQGREEVSVLRIHGDGWVDYSAPLSWLRHGDPGDDTRLIYPYALIERTVSLFRLTGTLYGRTDLRPEGAGLDFRVAADLALVGAKGWGLRPYSPKALGYQLGHEERALVENDLLLDRPLTFEARELVEQPDQCAYRLLIPVYESFGYSEDKIPSEFDRRSGRLILPT